MRSHLLSKVKRVFVQEGRRVRTVPVGLYRGLTLDLDLTCEMQLYLGLWERETHRYIKSAAQSCSWAIDVGAGKGELCLYLLEHAGIERIVAFEPQATEVEMLRRNLRLNRVSSTERLQVVQCFAGTSTRGDSRALDALGLPLERPGFVKIDVDGAELDVLQSGTKMFRTGRVSALVETHSQDLEAQALAFFAAHGYATRVVKNAWWRVLVPEQRPIPHNRWLWAWKGANG